MTVPRHLIWQRPRNISSKKQSPNQCAAVSVKKNTQHIHEFPLHIAIWSKYLTDVMEAVVYMSKKDWRVNFKEKYNLAGEKQNLFCTFVVARDIRHMLRDIEPEDFSERILSVSMFNDIEWDPAELQR